MCIFYKKIRIQRTPALNVIFQNISRVYLQGSVGILNAMQFFRVDERYLLHDTGNQHHPYIRGIPRDISMGMTNNFQNAKKKSYLPNTQYHSKFLYRTESLFLEKKKIESTKSGATLQFLHQCRSGNNGKNNLGKKQMYRQNVNSGHSDESISSCLI